MTLAQRPQQKVQGWVRDRVLSGGLKPGDRIPPYRSLSRELGLPYMTVWRAMQPLIEEGLLETRGRNGTFIRRTARR